MLNEPRLLKFILFFILAVLFFGFIVMGLWNSILTDILHVSKINFGQAIGILVLSKILFGGFRGGTGRRINRRWQIQHKMESMSPEEREKFKSEWRNRCNRWGQKNTDDTSETAK